MMSSSIWFALYRITQVTDSKPFEDPWDLCASLVTVDKYDILDPSFNRILQSFILTFIQLS